MIRKATVDDIPSIYKLSHQSALDLQKLEDFDYQLVIQKQGFAVVRYTIKDYKRLLETATYFFVYEEDNKIIGYIIVNSELNCEDENRYWFDKSVKERVYSAKTLLLYKIGVAVDFAGKSIATRLIKHIEKMMIADHYSGIVSIVTSNPLTNVPSILLHTKNEFNRVAVSIEPELHGGLENYTYLMFYKELG